METIHEDQIEKSNDLYQKLKGQSIFSLRAYGRQVGVIHPVLKKKEELIADIIKKLAEGGQSRSEQNG